MRRLGSCPSGYLDNVYAAEECRSRKARHISRNSAAQSYDQIGSGKPGFSHPVPHSGDLVDILILLTGLENIINNIKSCLFKRVPDLIKIQRCHISL